MLTIRRRLAWLALGLCATLAPALSTPLGDAVVVRLGEALRDAVPAEPLDFGARLARLGPVIAETCDIESMAKSTLGEPWETLSDEQHERYTKAFGNLLVASFAGRLEGEGAPNLTVLSKQEQPDGAELVHAELRRGEADPVKVDFGVHLVGEAWRIHSIESPGEESFAELGAQLRAAFAGSGPAGLVADIEQRAARFTQRPQDVVARLQSALLAAMRGGTKLGYEGRYALLRGVVTDTHDLSAITKLSIKSDWDDLSLEKRGQIERTLSDLSCATYAARFDDFHGERFDLVEEKSLRGSGVLVKTTLTKSNGKKVQLDYLLHRNRGRWAILNIVADGVSDLAVRRSEYQSLMKTKGFGGLLAKLEGQIARYAAGEKGD